MLKYCAFLLNPGAFFGDLIMCVPGQKGGYEDILTSYYLMKSGFYQWGKGCSNLEIQEIVGYSQFIMVANMVNHKQVSRLIKRIVTLRKDKDDDVDVIKYKY